MGVKDGVRVRERECVAVTLGVGDPSESVSVCDGSLDFDNVTVAVYERVDVSSPVMLVDTESVAVVDRVGSILGV